MTPGMRLLTLVWQHGMKDSWVRINHSMHAALSLAVGSGLKFTSKDFEAMQKQFRAYHWVGSEPEWIYTLAVAVGNRSAFEAWEKKEGRQAFMANAVRAQCYGGFIHANSIFRDRERLAVGFGFKMEGRVWFCTGFTNDGCVRVALYATDHQTGAPKKLRKLSHEELAALCPAKKKPKKEKSKEE